MNDNKIDDEILLELMSLQREVSDLERLEDEILKREEKQLDANEYDPDTLIHLDTTLLLQQDSLDDLGIERDQPIEPSVEVDNNEGSELPENLQDLFGVEDLELGEIRDLRKEVEELQQALKEDKKRIGKLNQEVSNFSLLKEIQVQIAATKAYVINPWGLSIEEINQALSNLKTKEFREMYSFIRHLQCKLEKTLHEENMSKEENEEIEFHISMCKRLDNDLEKSTKYLKLLKLLKLPYPQNEEMLLIHKIDVLTKNLEQNETAPDNIKSVLGHILLSHMKVGKISNYIYHDSNYDTAKEHHNLVEKVISLKNTTGTEDFIEYFDTYIGYTVTMLPIDYNQFFEESTRGESVALKLTFLKREFERVLFYCR